MVMIRYGFHSDDDDDGSNHDGCYWGDGYIVVTCNGGVLKKLVSLSPLILIYPHHLSH